MNIFKLEFFNPLVHRNFTLSRARRFYSSIGWTPCTKGLRPFASFSDVKFITGKIPQESEPVAYILHSIPTNNYIC